MPIPLKTRLDEDIKTAMKAKDAVALRALRALKAAVLVAETVEGRHGKEISEAEEIQILSKQARQRKDSIEQFEANGRADLAVGEHEELAVIERYLPKALTEAKVEAAVRSLIAESGAKGPGDMGKVMKLATQALAGQVDGKALSETVKRLLAQ